LEKLRSREVEESRSYEVEGPGAEKFLLEESKGREVRAVDDRLFEESNVEEFGDSVTIDFSTLQPFKSSTL